MSQLPFDDEDYYFQISEELETDKEFVLIIYDIVDNRKRVKMAKLLSGYGKRVQKSAFEAMISESLYRKLVAEIPQLICEEEDSVRVYRIMGYGEVSLFGVNESLEDEEVIII